MSVRYQPIRLSDLGLQELRTDTEIELQRIADAMREIDVDLLRLENQPAFPDNPEEGQLTIVNNELYTYINNTWTSLGDVVGPASATPDNVVTFNGSTGKSIQDSGRAISDVPSLANANTWNGAQTWQGENIHIMKDNDATTAYTPTFRLVRESGVGPAADGPLAELAMWGDVYAPGTSEKYAYVRARSRDRVNNAERASLHLGALKGAGTDEYHELVVETGSNAGIYASGATGEGMGEHTLNVKGLYVDGVDIDTLYATTPVGNADLADMGAYTLKMRDAATSGDPVDKKISELATTHSPVVGGDKILVESSLVLGQAAVSSLPFDKNAAANIGTGVGVFDELVGTTPNFKALNSLTSNLTIVDAGVNQEIEFDLLDAPNFTGGITAGKFSVDASDNVVTGTAELAAAATDGFLYIPNVPTAPSGTPTAKTGMSPICFCRSDNKIYLYDGDSSSWIATAALT